MVNRENTTKEFEKDMNKIDEKLDSMNKGKVKEIWTHVEALYKMIRDLNAALTSKAAAIGALIYLISTIDAIPDIIPIAGLSDDVAVILAVISTLGFQLKEYMIDYKKETTNLEKQLLFEIEEKIEKAKRKSQEKFIIKIILLIGIILVIIALILKLL